jgi:hypothetical protein
MSGWNISEDEKKKTEFLDLSDKYAGYNLTCALEGMKLQYLPSDSTAVLQILDVGFIFSHTKHHSSKAMNLLLQKHLRGR